MGVNGLREREREIRERENDGNSVIIVEVAP